MNSSSRTPGRRSFLAGAAALSGAGLLPRPAAGFVPAHNWDGYDWGTAPQVRDRLNQGPFPQYPPEEVLPGSEVVMATTPSNDVVPGFGKGLVTYLTGDFAAATFEGRDVESTIEENPARAEALPAPHLARPAEAARPSRPGGVREGRARGCTASLSASA